MEWIVGRLLILPGILIGLSLHEYSHALTANVLGDSTAKDEGRLTIEPWAHISFLGFIFFMIIGIGWAKPVPINSANFKKPRRDEILVSIAGPLANFLIAIVTGIAFVLVAKNGVWAELKSTEMIYNLFSMTIFINILLGIFNLIPIPPLDGSHILYNILPKSLKYKYMKLYQLQAFIVLILLFTNVLHYILYIPAEFLYESLMNFLYSIL